MQRIREETQNPYALPASRDAMIIPDDMTKTEVNRTFLQYYSGLTDKGSVRIGVFPYNPKRRLSGLF